MIVLIQYIPRVFLIISLNSEIVKASGAVTRTACHVLGALWNYKYGLFADALNLDVVGATFFEKYLYCLWWGFRNFRRIWDRAAGETASRGGAPASRSRSAREAEIGGQWGGALGSKSAREAL